MTDTQKEEEAIFHAVRRLNSHEQRAQYLAQACGDDRRLLNRIEALLKIHDGEQTFDGVRISPTPSLAGNTESALRIGTIIGRYKLLEQIGEGGFGTVFMAEQQHPVRRKVALKIIKLGMDTKQVIARFEAERQALALMDHPNIARVLDAGATDSGRPYFVMELVKGMPLTEFCDQNDLTARQRLELFIAVCQAVQHAHQKGIIHRDLKPSNVLVAIHDTTPVPKVIDFGIAKALGQELTDKTLFTGYVQMVGTPLYMSPEQAGQSGLDIDTRSDIYSLGVLLYELLTGTTPFNKERLKQAALDELRRIIRDEEPPKPSTRLSESKHSLPMLSNHRQAERVRLTRLVRGELDWIVMKALEKDRNRRYETATALAADVQRYLHDQAVLACPPTPGYRLRKIVRRHKGPVWAAALVLLALVGGIIGTTLGLVEARRQRDAAAVAAVHETIARERAEKAQHLAEERGEDIREGLERLKATSAHLDRGRWYAGERHWDDAHAALTKAIQLRPDHVSVWVERGDLYTRLGLWDLAAADYAREFALREPDTALRWYQHALLRYYIGDVDGHRETCERMRERFRGTLQADFVEDVVRSCVLVPNPDTDFSQLVELLKELVVHKPRSSLSILGIAHYRARQDDQAIRRLNEALSEQPSLALSLLNYAVLAMAHHRQGRAVEARAALNEGAKIFDKWTFERYWSQRDHWVIHHGAVAVWPVMWWDYLEGELYYREAKLLIDGFAPPDDPRMHVLRARAFAGLRWPEKAVLEYDAALKLSPQDSPIRLEVHRTQGARFVHLRQWSAAAAEFAKASELRPDDSYLWRFRAMANIAVGDMDAYRQTCSAMVDRFEKTNDPASAGNVLLSCSLRDDTLPDMARLIPLTRVAAPLWHWGTWTRGAALYRARRYEESVQCFETAARKYRPRAWDWCFLAMAHHHLGHAGQAHRCVSEANRWIEEANREKIDDLSDTRPAWGDWYERVVYPLLLREAEAIVGNEGGK